jgi:flagellar biosynthesis protein FlhA
VIEFDIDQKLVEQFQAEASAALKPHLDRGQPLAVVTTSEARSYVRMMIERLLPNVPVLSTLEIARGVDIKTLGSIS